MSIFKAIKKRLVEPSTSVALSMLALLIKPDFDVDTINQVYVGVVGILAGLGIIQPEGERKND